MATKKTKEPLFHVAKRDALPTWKAWGIRSLAILGAVVACAIIILIVTKQNPLEVYLNFFTGAFGTPRLTWKTFQYTAILLIISLALTPAFKMKFWNIGGEGQVLIGGLACATCMIFLSDKLPYWLVVVLMFVMGMVAGAIWGLIPAIFKAKWNTNETLSTLMMNYIAIQIVAICCNMWETRKGHGTIDVIEGGQLPMLGGNRYLLIIIIAVVVTALLFVYLNYTKHGYEISVVGESQNTARYVGIKVGKVIIRTMALSGAICGLAGVLIVGGKDYTISTNAAGGQGFTAVMVSWLAKFNPAVMVIASLLIIFMQNGASNVATKVGLNESFSDILTAILLFFIIGCEFFIQYKICVNKRTRKEASHV